MTEFNDRASDSPGEADTDDHASQLFTERPKLPKKKPKSREETPVFSARIDRKLKETFDQWASRKGLTKGEATAFALRMAMHAEP